MKFKALIAAGLVATLVAAPLSSASAYGRDYGRGHGHFHDPLLLPFIAAGALLTGVAIVATAPFRAIGDGIAYSDAPPPMPQRVVYAAPPQGYYGGQPVYYAPPPRYYAQPAYYPPPRGYYAYRNY